MNYSRIINSLDIEELCKNSPIKDLSDAVRLAKQAAFLALKKAQDQKPERYYVYSITCLMNNKIYVGVTNSIKNRARSHIYLLRKKRHNSVDLQVDFLKYGEDAFTFDLICECENIADAYLQEKFLTESVFKLNKNVCYNTISGGADHIQQASKIIKKLRNENPEYSKEMGKKSRDTKIKKYGKASGFMTPEVLKASVEKRARGNNPRAKKIIDQATGQVYNSYSDAADALGMSYSSFKNMIVEKRGYKNRTSFKHYTE